MKNMLKASALRATPICAALICAAMCASALAQSTTPSSSSSSSSADSDQPQSAPAGATANPVAQPSRIAPGTVIPVQLTKTIDAKKAKTGDEVVAKVSQDLKTPSGEILVPKDSKIVGHVTEARARTKDQKDSEVAIAFDHAATKNGDMQLPMSIQAIIAPQNNDSADAGGGNPSYGNSPSPSMGGGGGRSPMSGGSSPAPQPQSPSNMPSSGMGQSGGSARPPITASTQGVIGMSDVKLAANAENAQGSVVSSEKNNVKLESGTIMLLRVNQ